MFTAYRNCHNQVCPHCGRFLETCEDWSGGGSHYWVLECCFCEIVFTYNTYSFKLLQIKEIHPVLDWVDIAELNSTFYYVNEPSYRYGH